MEDSLPAVRLLHYLIYADIGSFVAKPTGRNRHMQGGSSKKVYCLSKQSIEALFFRGS